MRGESIALMFENLYERLDRFFHQRLKQAGVQSGIEFWKEELIQETFLAVLIKLQKDQYNDYSFTALVFLKANDVWVTHVRAMRKHPPNEPIDEASLKIRQQVLLKVEEKDELK